MERIKARLRELEKTDPAIEFRFSLPDLWSHRLLMALLQRYGIKAYRYSGQRHSTIMIRASRRFIDETLIPEYEQFRETLVSYFEVVTQRVVSHALGINNTEPDAK
jgi:hypothetical protein